MISGSVWDHVGIVWGYLRIVLESFCDLFGHALIILRARFEICVVHLFGSRLDYFGIVVC